jgi:S1-C subfamily serine protease
MIAIRSRIRLLLVLALLTACVGQAQAEEETATDLYAHTLRGTALVATPTGGGTGWVIDLDQRLLVTNEHVVTTHDQVKILFPLYGTDGSPLAEPAHYAGGNRALRAEVIDTDARRDLAILRLLEPPPPGVTALKLAEREPRPAERVHSVGNPEASDALWVYSTGAVRQVYRKEWRVGTGPLRSARVVESQSPINPGDSGGPVVNDAGAVVAVVSG